MTSTQNSFAPAAAAEANAASRNIGDDRRVNSAGGNCTGAVELYPGTTTRKKRSRRLTGSEAGMATAEYAIATLAAVGFAGLLVFILRSEEVRGFLLTLIRTALALP